MIDNINNDPKFLNSTTLTISLKFMEEQPTTILQFYKSKLKTFEEWQLFFLLSLSSLDKT